MDSTTTQQSLMQDHHNDDNSNECDNNGNSNGNYCCDRYPFKSSSSSPKTKTNNSNNNNNNKASVFSPQSYQDPSLFPSPTTNPKAFEEWRSNYIRHHSHADNHTAWRQLWWSLFWYLLSWSGLLYSPPPYHYLFLALMPFTLLRLFMIFHDCGHMSYFEDAESNRLVGKWLAILVMTPYGHWQGRHNYHHHTFGNLDLPDTGQTIVFTKKEYEKMVWYKKYFLRFVRDPFVFFFLLPLYAWGFECPFIHGDRYTSLGVLYYFLMFQYFSPLIPLALYLAGIMGVMLFHWQHAVNSGYRCRTTDRDEIKAAFLGSTYLPLPFPISYFTFGIEFHHIHHFSTRVPSYKLAQVHSQAPPIMWHDVTVVDLKKALLSLLNVMWDEDTQQLLSFYPIST